MKCSITAAGGEGLIPLWVGEGDLPTPGFISDAAAKSLAAGETFYTHQRGIPELRAALARYHQRTYGKPFAPERFFVTVGGMQAIQTACRMVSGTGDEVLIPQPAWPNLPAAIGISGATPVPVPMTLGNAGWTLDLDRLFASVTPRTTAIFLNSPTNPTGWTATPRPPPRHPRLCAASAACGSSPTRSITASSMPASARPPSMTLPSRTSASSTSTPSPRTGR